MGQTIEVTSKELVLQAKSDPSLLFRSPENGGVRFDHFLEYVKTEASEAGSSTETAKDRAAIRSMAEKIKKTRTGIEKASKDIQADLRDRAAKVKSHTASMAERLDELRETVREPLTKFEIEEKKRKEAEQVRLRDHKDRLDYIDGLADDRIWLGKDWLQQRVHELKEFQNRDFEEFQDSANLKIENVMAALLSGIAEIERKEAEQAELEELRRFKAEREAAERKNASKEPASEDLQNEVFEPEQVKSPAVSETTRSVSETREPVSETQATEPETTSPVSETKSGIPSYVRPVKTGFSEEDLKRMTAAKQAVMEAATLPEDAARAVVRALVRGQIPFVKFERG